MTEVTLLGIDLAKEIFQLHGIDAAGKAVLKNIDKNDSIKFARKK